MHLGFYKAVEGSVGRHADLTCFRENSDGIAGSFTYCLVSFQIETTTAATTKSSGFSVYAFRFVTFHVYLFESVAKENKNAERSVFCTCKKERKERGSSPFHPQKRRRSGSQ